MRDLADPRSAFINTLGELGMFFDLKLYQKTKTKLSLGKNTVCLFGETQYSDCIKQLIASNTSLKNGTIKEIKFVLGLSEDVINRIGKYRSSSPNDEEYAIAVDTVTTVWAASTRAFIYATSTLCALYTSGELQLGFLYDYPLLSTRGYRAYLPSRAGIYDFYKAVDFLSELKYNSIILEIGGAMQYDRHPRINEVWSEFCKEVHKYSGRAHEIQQKTYPWLKNSIHCDNAEGDILTKEECRKIAQYCRSRGLEVIPECPTLSHCDYLVMAYPHLSERKNDAYPDSYCPNHPDVYRYVFDILEEVIEVFEPARINIGHDEAYSVRICKRCKPTPAPVLYANDVNRIHAFLKEKGIRTMMWGEKLLNARYYPGNGSRIGGAGHGKGDAHVHALFPCRDLISRDVEMLHWYYPFNKEYDKVYHSRGFKTYFSNLSVLDVESWDLRIKQGILGAFVSNWGSFGEEYMQRNMQFFDLIASAYAFWCERFGKMSYEDKLFKTLREAYRIKNKGIKSKIKIIHTTAHKINYKFFYDGVFIVDSTYLLGHYRLTYNDGRIANLQVKYGSNISCKYYDENYKDSGIKEVSYSTLPIKYRDGFAYETVYENPYPDGSIKSIEYVPAKEKENISVELLHFSVDFDQQTQMRTVEATGEDFAWDGGMK